MLKKIINHIIIKTRGPMELAKRKGMKVGDGCSEMQGVDYGSEPYLITIGNDVRISNNVLFVTHDGGSWVIRREGPFKDTVCYGRISVGNNVFIGARSIIILMFI